MLDTPEVVVAAVGLTQQTHHLVILFVVVQTELIHHQQQPEVLLSPIVAVAVVVEVILENPELSVVPAAQVLQSLKFLLHKIILLFSLTQQHGLHQQEHRLSII